MTHGENELMNKNDQRILAVRNRWNFKMWIVCATALLFAAKVTSAGPGSTASGIASGADADRQAKQWVGTWATSAQPFLPASLQTYRNQSLRPESEVSRKIVHDSPGGLDGGKRSG
jgi:hypothetical protein